jgi:pimeloyl-ACP methyl ester carboxylesterase
MTIPTLIMQGKKDVLIPPKNAEVLQGLIPNSELTFFEHTAHALFSQLDKVLSRLIDFLED